MEKEVEDRSHLSPEESEIFHSNHSVDENETSVSISNMMIEEENSEPKDERGAHHQAANLPVSRKRCVVFLNIWII